jgi:hypothetical protein
MRLLLAAQHQTGSHVAGLLWTAERARPLAPFAIRGDGMERLRGLELGRTGELAQLLAALGRPARWAELDRFPELRAAVAPFVAHGFSLLAPLRGVRGLEGVLVVDERPDAREFSPDDLEALAVLCDAAAVALENAARARGQAEGTLAVMTAEARRETAVDVVASWAEAGEWVGHAADAITLAGHERTMLSRALALGSWALEPAGARALTAAADADGSGLFEALLHRLARAQAPMRRDEMERPDEHRSAMLLGVAKAYADARVRRSDLTAATEHALAWAGNGLDNELRDALLSQRPAGSRASR